MSLANYAPENQEKFDEMLRDLRKPKTHEQFKEWTLLYMRDMSYSRSDLMVVIDRIERERGWRSKP